MAKILPQTLSILEFGYKTETSFNLEASSPIKFRKSHLKALSPRNTLESIESEEFSSSFKKHFPPRFGTSIQDKYYIKTFPGLNNRESTVIERPSSTASFFFSSSKGLGHREKRHFHRESSFDKEPSPVRRLLSPGKCERQSSIDEIFGRRSTNILDKKKSQLMLIGGNDGNKRYKSPDYSPGFFKSRQSTQSSLKVFPESQTPLVKSSTSLMVDTSPKKFKVNDDARSQGSPKMQSLMTWAKPTKKTYDVEFRPLRTTVSRRGFRINNVSNGIFQMSQN